MNWRALILAVVALSVYSPFVNDSFCAEPSCCAQMESCCDHCDCPGKQSCSVAKPVTVDQQAIARAAELAPRIFVELFTLSPARVVTLAAHQQSLSWLPESPPPKPAQPPQSRLCVWLI
jgi:hypothetical protein